MKVYELYSKYENLCDKILVSLKYLISESWNWFLNTEVTFAIISVTLLFLIIGFRKNIKEFFIDFLIWMGDEEMIAKRKRDGV